jgi:hypothetical protein
MFILPAYDATALAMLGFGILAGAALADSPNFRVSWWSPNKVRRQRGARDFLP